MRRPVVGLAAVALLVATACDDTDDREAAPFQPSIAWGECPSDVEVTFTARHECGVLTVLVDRADPSKGTLELTVGRAWPQDVEIGTATASPTAATLAATTRSSAG